MLSCHDPKHKMVDRLPEITRAKMSSVDHSVLSTAASQNKCKGKTDYNSTSILTSMYAHLPITGTRSQTVQSKLRKGSIVLKLVIM